MKTLKANSLSLISAAILILLFGYTAISKILAYNKFVFQMKLAQMSIIALLAPLLGILAPIHRTSYNVLLYKDNMRLKGFYASFLLLF